MSLFKTFIKLVLGLGTYRSYSQFGEDIIIRAFVPKKGFYVDVGSYHPILYSNTYRLYRNGWNGIAIDPNRTVGKLFSLFRPRDRFVNAGVGQTAEKTYFEFADGAYNTFDPTRVESYKRRSAFMGSRTVSIKPLREILEGVTRIDLMNVDVEGLDLEVLQTHDWEVKPKVIIVEALPDTPAGEFLRAKGYSLAGLTKLNSIFLLP